MNMSALFSGTRQVVVRRVYEATCDDLFDAWSDPEKLNQWWGPEGFKTTIEEFNFEVGGSFRIRMISPSGSVGATAGIYRRIRRPCELTFEMTEHCNCDLDGIKPQTGHGIVTVVFSDLDEGRAEVVLTHDGLSSTELANRHTAGWSSSLHNLGTVSTQVLMG